MSVVDLRALRTATRGTVRTASNFDKMDIASDDLSNSSRCYDQGEYPYLWILWSIMYVALSIYERVEDEYVDIFSSS